ncbi:MAG: hypothetical protein IE922_09580 [Sphingomonadales bacterium]|nr:hypothetical protein [Sphingomonadales bacterium]
MACTFDPAAAQGGPAASPLHPAQLAQDWAILCARTAAQRPALLYLHRGQQPDTRCPILQDLLAVLDHRGAVHALRVETPAARRDALAIARALTPRHGLLLVLHDPTQRLCLAPRAMAPLRFLLLATQTQARRLQATAPHGAAPSHALHTETSDVRS